MGLLDKVHKDLPLLADRANNKLEQLEDLSTKLLLPGFKQIEKDLKKLGVDLPDLNVSKFGFSLDTGKNFIFAIFVSAPARADLDSVYIEPFYGPDSFSSSTKAFQKLSLPSLPSSLEDSGMILDLNFNNISDFEKYMDELMSYITRNNTLIVETIEDAVVEILKSEGKL